jgi:hypothetical protein
MKWLKHMTAAWDDEKLAALVGEGGEAGLARYSAYWRIAEMVASQMEGASPSCSLSYPLWRWARELLVRKSYAASILLRLQKEGLIGIEGDLNTGQSVTVKMPNLLKYRDEYSKKSGQNQERVGAKNRTDRDTEGREEKTIASSDEKPRSAPAEIPTSQVKKLGTLPLNDGTLFEITDAMVAEWQELYPAVDVEQQCRNMKGWCIGNPTRLKSPKGILRFINSWLDREQNKGGSTFNKFNGGNGNGKFNGATKADRNFAAGQAAVAFFENQSGPDGDGSQSGSGMESEISGDRHGTAIEGKL